jgi:superfamily II DNA or RNA helicase
LQPVFHFRKDLPVEPGFGGFMAAPDRRQYKDFADTIRRADLEVGQVARGYGLLVSDVQTEYRALREAIAVDLLKTHDVEELNTGKEGIRVKALRDAGIRTVADVCKASQRTIEFAPGIGAVMAAKAKRNAEAIRITVARTVRVQLDAEDKRIEQSRLILALARLMAARPYTQRAADLYSKSHGGIVTRLEVSSCIAGTLSWFFTGSEKKQQALLAYDELQQYVSETYAAETTEIIDGYQYAVNLDLPAAKADFAANAAAFYALLFAVVEGNTEAQTDYGGIPEELVSRVSETELHTDGLQADLRRYQVFGTKYILYGKRVLLGDEMGLGKTVEAIAAMTHLRAEGKTHFLVVCPLSVLVNWQREVARFSNIPVDEIYGYDRAEELSSWIEKGGTAITTYETCSKIDLPDGFAVDMLVVDEAHFIKNASTIRSRAVRLLIERSQSVLFMSGTPLENRVEEMLTLIGFLQPEIMEKAKHLTGLSDAERFRNVIAPVYLRRTREQVLTELPDKEEVQEWNMLGEEETEAYRKALSGGNFMEIRRVSWNVPAVRSGKALRLKEIVEEAEQDGRKILVFSYFRNTLRNVEALLGNRCAGVIDGALPMKARQEILDRFREDPDKTVLICQIVAGGVGLNVQEANVIIICEPQLKPSMEEQAIGRAYRMGQSRKVVVHRLLSAKTVDERIMDILSGKRETFLAFANESVVGNIDRERAIGEAAVEEIIAAERERYGIDKNPDETTEDDG